jgi:hypothetical protein
MAEVCRPMLPQPKIRERGYDHCHWTVKGGPETKLIGDCGVTHGCPQEEWGEWEYVGRGRSGYHYTLAGPFRSPFGSGVKNVRIEWRKGMHTWVGEAGDG